MPSEVTTLDPKGLGAQTGRFSAPLGAPINQSWFDAAFAGRVHNDKIYKEAYNCQLLGECNMSTWMEEYMGFDTSCFPAYTLLEYNSGTMQITVGGLATTVIPTRAGGTGTITLAANSHYVNGTYVLPQVGNILVLTPVGELAEVISVTTTAANTTAIVIRLISTTAGAQTLKLNDKLMVLPGSYLDDCECPSGQFRFDDMPIEHDLIMKAIGDKGELCGDALNKCQYLKIPFTDDCGNTIEKWYTKALSDMYKDHERTKHYSRLLDPVFGVIPAIKSRGMRFTPALETAITTDDIREWKRDLDAAGITCREYAVFAGGDKYSQFQRMLLAAGVVQLDASQQPLADCKWLNMEWCGIRVEGMVLHIYEECSFSNGKLLGGNNMVFPNSAIFVPMCERTTNCRGAYDNKMLTTVYFKTNSGVVWDNLTDSNGILNGPGGRNTFGTGCEEHEWTIKSRFTQEVHCPNFWGYMGLF